MENIHTALNNWRRMLVLPDNVDFSDPIIQKKIDVLNRDAENALRDFSPKCSYSLFLKNPPEKTGICPQSTGELPL